MKFRPYFCPGCGVWVTREPWPHLDRGLLAVPAPPSTPAAPDPEGGAK